MSYRLPEELIVGQVGVGGVGQGIVSMFLNAELPVIAYDEKRDPPSIRDGVAADLAQLGEHGLLGPSIGDSLGRLEVVDSLQGLVRCNYVTEAVLEILEVKRDVMEALAKLLPEACLVSNTSSLRPEEFIGGLSNPERFAVTHFLKPAQIAPLMEVGSAHDQTSEALVTDLYGFFRGIGKHPITVYNIHWPINTIQFSVVDTALRLYQTGGSAKDIDQAMVACSEHWLNNYFGNFPSELHDKRFASDLWESTQHRAAWIEDQGTSSKADIQYTIKSHAARWKALGGVLAVVDAGGIPVFKDIYANFAGRLGFEDPPLTLDQLYSQGRIGWKSEPVDGVRKGFHEWTDNTMKMAYDSLISTMAQLSKEHK